MNIKIVISQPVTHACHGELAARLRQLGHDVHFSTAEHDNDVPRSLLLLRRLENLTRSAPGAKEGVRVEPILGHEHAADLTIDLTFSPRPRAGVTLVPLCDGVPGYAGLCSALLDGRSPEIGVLRVAPAAAAAAADAGKLVATGRAAIDRPKRFGISFDATCARLGDLIVEAVRCPRPGHDTAPAVVTRTDVPVARAGTFVISSLARHLAAKLQALLRRPDHWSVGWRRIGSNDAVGESLRWPDAAFTFLPDDGARFYADPFVFMRDDVAWVFVEEFPYATRKGIISVCSIDAHGTVSTPRPVLETPYHLSYPHVFERNGMIWMIPETSANRTIELYRAERFPDEWVRHAILVGDVDASDATLVERDGRLWIFAALHPGVTSSRDALGLFHADDLTGPWRAHPANPVLVDAAAARPAGAMFERGGELWRPAQNCTRGYGSGLTLCRVERLDLEGYAQTPVVNLLPPAAWHAEGVHTLNAASGIEVIDRVRSISRF